MNKTEINNQESKCITDKNNEELKCTTKCFKRAVKYTIATGILSILAFVAGFFLQPFITRALWLILTGMLTTLSGIVLYFLFTKSCSNEIEFNCNEL